MRWMDEREADVDEEDKFKGVMNRIGEGPMGVIEGKYRQATRLKHEQ